jgi:hypothetical protein
VVHIFEERKLTRRIIAVGRWLGVNERIAFAVNSSAQILLRMR